MAHLTVAEQIKGLESLFKNIFGVENYSRWIQLKARLNFVLEEEFVAWILDVIESAECDNSAKADPQGDDALVCDNPVYSGMDQYQSQNDETEVELEKSVGNTTLFRNENKKKGKHSYQQQMEADDQYYTDSSDSVIASGYNDQLARNSEVQENNDGNQYDEFGNLFDKRQCDFPTIMESSSTCSNNVCTICEKVFSHKSNLRAHMNAVHLGVKFSCHYCNRQFTSKQNLKNHLLRKHNVSFSEDGTAT